MVAGRDAEVKRLSVVLISAAAIFGLQRAWADQVLQVSGQVVIPHGRSTKCAVKTGCPCSFAVRQSGERCRVTESLDALNSADEFDSHPGRTWVVDAGSGTSACGVRLRCEFVLQVEACHFILPDGGVGPACSTPDAN